MHGVNIRSALCLGHFSHPNQSADKHRLLHKQKSYRTNVLQLLALDLIVDTMRSVSILHLLLANSATLAFGRGNDRSNFFKQFRGVDHYQSKFLTYSCNTLIEEIWV